MSPEGVKKGDAPKPRGKVIGGFEILSRLGRGGMGAVYKARQVSMNRRVALKLLPPNLARDEKFVQRFEREARAAGALSHPNIVAGIDVGEADGFRYFAMEYVEGESVADRIGREDRLPPREAARIAAQIADALAHAHANGLIHRDIKPGNILLAANGTAKLCDLGLARSAGQTDHDITLAGTALGTPNYISPEQIEGHGNVDGRSDLYSLGATLYYMVAGQPPFSAPTTAKIMSMHLTDVPMSISEVVPGVHPGLALIISRLLKKKPEERYTSAETLAKDLASVASGGMPRSFAAATGRRRQSTGPRRGATRRTVPVDAVAAERDEEDASWFRGWRLGVVLATPIACAVAAFFVLSLMEPGPTEAELAAAKTERAALASWNASVRDILDDEPSREEAGHILAAL